MLVSTWNRHSTCQVSNMYSSNAPRIYYLLCGGEGGAGEGDRAALGQQGEQHQPGRHALVPATGIKWKEVQIVEKVLPGGDLLAPKQSVDLVEEAHEGGPAGGLAVRPQQPLPLVVPAPNHCRTTDLRSQQRKTLSHSLHCRIESAHHSWQLLTRLSRKVSLLSRSMMKQQRRAAVSASLGPHSTSRVSNYRPEHTGILDINKQNKPVLRAPSPPCQSVCWGPPAPVSVFVPEWRADPVLRGPAPPTPPRGPRLPVTYHISPS